MPVTAIARRFCAVALALTVMVAALLSDGRIREAVAAEGPGTLEPVPIAVIDFRLVLSQSEAAQKIRAAVEARRAVHREALDKLEKELQAEQQALAEQRQLMTAEAFQQRVQDLQERARRAQHEAQQVKARLQRAFETAMQRVQQELYAVCAALAQETGAGVVLFRNAIVVAVKTLEISQVALDRLNQQLPEVEVVFETQDN